MLYLTISKGVCHRKCFALFRSSQQLNCMRNPYDWLKPNIQHPSGSSGPINLLTNMRSSQDIPDVITGTLSTNDKEKKLKAVVPPGCMSKPLSNAKGQSTGASGEPQQAPRRQVRFIQLIW